MFLTILKICGASFVIVLTICFIVIVIASTIDAIKGEKENKEENKTDSEYGWHGGVYKSPPDE